MIRSGEVPAAHCRRKPRLEEVRQRVLDVDGNIILDVFSSPSGRLSISPSVRARVSHLVDGAQPGPAF